MAFIEQERRRFIDALCGDILGTKTGGAPTMSDADSTVSVQIGEALLRRLAAGPDGHTPAAGVSLQGQQVGDRFDRHVADYVDRTFVGGMSGLRSGTFEVTRGVHIKDTAQYMHLEVLRQIGEDPAITTSSFARHQFRAVIATDYQVQADIVVLRKRDGAVVGPAGLVSPTSGLAKATPLIDRGTNQPDLLHANISCKWTFRSDRAQNIRTEALALLRHRKGPMPHMVVVTAEPLPSRLRSIAIGTGEVDCVYHAALLELRAALDDCIAAAPSLGRQRERALAQQMDVFSLMTDGDRLRDISDLPFDLAI